MPTQPFGGTKRQPHFRRLMSIFGGLTLVGMGLVMGAPTAVADPTQQAVDAINQRYTEFGGATSLLGTPVGAPVDTTGGARQDYTGGAIFYSEKSGAHVMYGQILEKYRALGGPDANIGYPTNDESAVGDNQGRFNDFSQPGGAAIYWTPNSGAWLINGKVLEAWRASGAGQGPFGYPIADMTDVSGASTARFAGPQGTEMSWSDSAGLTTVPAALAATIPGFAEGRFSGMTPSPEGTVAAPTPPGTVSAPSTDTSTRGFNWWPWVIGLAILGLLGALWAALARRGRPAEMAVAPQVKVPPADIVPPRPAPPRATASPRLVDTGVPPVKVPPAEPREAAPPPWTRSMVSDRARPVGGNGSGGNGAGAAPSPRRPVVEPPAVKPPTAEPPARSVTPQASKVADFATASASAGLVDRTAGPPAMVVNFEDNEAKHLGGIEVTYENNAVGANQQSRDDKSDLR